MPVLELYEDELYEEELAALTSLDSESHMVPLFLSSISSECTTDRCGFHRSETRLGFRGGLVGAEGVDSAHDPEAVGGRTIGY